MFPKFFSRRWIALVPVLLLLFPFPVQSQTEEEMAILSLYYRPEDLQVISATRSPKPISQVAENISVINAAEIRAMNAHTVGEVLRQVPGIHNNTTGDFGQFSLIGIQGSYIRHVQVYVDEIPWNTLTGGNAVTVPIPVGIIDRIEIVKGPGSSAWGSSLGGVIHIITKAAGHSPTPSGRIRASYGESDTQDHRAEVSGKVDSLGYYLHAAHRETDGLVPVREREMDGDSLFAKWESPLGDIGRFTLSSGYFDTYLSEGDYPLGDFTAWDRVRTFFVRAGTGNALTRKLDLDLSGYTFHQKFVTGADTLGIEAGVPEFLYGDTYDEHSAGANAKLNYRSSSHNLVMGFQYDYGRLDQRSRYGPYYQSFGLEEKVSVDSDRYLWAVYVNDTITLGRWTFTPGLRYDDHEISGGFLSPSLGVTCKVAEKTLLRASGARGFTSPSLSLIQGGGFFLDPNPDLDPEEVWSAQIGAETEAIPYLWLRATAFYHDTGENQERVFEGGGEPLYNDIYLNSGDIRRRGIELEFETIPVSDTAFFGGTSFVDIDPELDTGSSEIYQWIAGVRYTNPRIINARFTGIYTWWGGLDVEDVSYDDPIWDLNLSRGFSMGKEIKADLFLTAHNIFSGASYSRNQDPNPDLWVEAGVRFEF